jgi:ATP-dependent RNA helicase SUPV3L1/SUV3
MHSGRIAGVLGPTNTGKTHYAIERMLAHRTGIIGLPLRLLAREVYDKVVAIRGPSVVALLTGEERIIPPRVQYWVCTVEAMPQNNGVDFVAIDEIQLCADPERGHLFTQRLLSARGLHETLFLGSDTMRGPISQLIPEAIFIRRERLSKLSYAGSKKISRMPTRSAIVGFSVDNVYAMAELLRRQKGGTAVVLGALSPRTRNAQVELYQNGEVDYLVATDAIGMGLNLDVHHVAFSGLSKFDGRRMRPLAPNELAQIAGRAGRGMADGSFGVTGEAPNLDEGVANAIVNHRFTPIKRLQWRNSDLAFSNVDILIKRLGISPTNEVFIKARESDDLIALKNLAEMPEVRARAANTSSVRLLWDICRIPDFRGISPAEHANLLSIIFNHLHETGKLPEAWLARQINLIDRIDGDIDTLSKRLAFIRTWTYVAQSGEWLEDVEYWREATRAIEDRLSDALHKALTRRFVDRRTSVLLRRLKQKEGLLAEVNDNGEVTVEGEFVGRLEGFRFLQDKNATGTEAKTLKAASLQALMPYFNLRADRFYNAPDTELDFTDQGGLMWGEHAVGKLEPGDDSLKPQIRAFVDDTAGQDVMQKVQRRLQHFIDRKIASLFEPLMLLQRDEALNGLARGFAFRMVEGFGILPRPSVVDDVKALDQDARGMLRKHGVRFGQFTIFMPLLLKPAATRLRILLWSLARKLDEFPISPPPGLVTIPVDTSAPAGYDIMAGYRNSNTRAIRIDMLERLADMIRVEDTRVGFEAKPDMLSITGMTLEQFSDLLQGLGYNAEKLERDKVKLTKPGIEPVEKIETSTEAGDLASKGPSYNSDLQTSEAEIASDPLVDWSLGDQFSEETSADTQSADREVVNSEALNLVENPAPVEKETYFVFTWPTRNKPKQNSLQRDFRKSDDQGNTKSRPKGKRMQHKDGLKPKTHQSKPEKTKKIDPDNPFAEALMGLKTRN